MNLAEAVGENAKVPSNTSDQPEQYFKGFKFHLLGFIGSDSTTVKEVKIFDMVCEGTTLSFSSSMRSYQNMKLLHIRCSCGR